MQKCFVSIISRRNSSIVCKEREENCIFIQFLYFSRTRHMSRMQHTRQNAIFVLKNVLHLYLCIYRTFRIYVHHTDVLSDQFQVSLESSKNVMKLPQGIFLLFYIIQFFFPSFILQQCLPLLRDTTHEQKYCSGTFVLLLSSFVVPLGLANAMQK